MSYLTITRTKSTTPFFPQTAHKSKRKRTESGQSQTILKQHKVVQRRDVEDEDLVQDTPVDLTQAVDGAQPTTTLISQDHQGTGVDENNLDATGIDTIQVSPDDVKAALQVLDEKDVRETLEYIGTGSKVVAAWIKRKGDRKITEVHDSEDTFMQLCDDVRTLYQDAHMLEGKGASYAALHITNVIKDIISIIRKGAPKHASFATKKSALSTLTSLAGTVIGSGLSRVAWEVYGAIAETGVLENTISDIVDSMDEYDKEHVLKDRSLVRRMKLLVGVQDGQGVHLKMKAIFERLPLEVEDEA